jgi:glycosyltransferase involved in cell wall biosynthesis
MTSRKSVDIHLNPKVAFVTNFCPHYRARSFELLANHCDTTYFFFSAGGEWYWDQAHGVGRGNFRHEYLTGIQIGRTRIPYTLPCKLWRGNYDVYLKCINGRFALPITYAIARLRGKPFVLWTGIWMRLQTPMHRLAWPLTKFIYLHADAIVTYGTHVKQYLINEGVPAERLFPSHHAVHNPDYNQAVPDEAIRELRRNLGLTTGQKVVLFVGRLVEVKGLSYLLDAFARISVPGAVLVLVGQGPEEARLRQQVECLGLTDRIRFVGYIPTNQTTIYYAMAWVHVLPSITTPAGRETWGLVINEAFNQGVPSIATTAVGAAAGGLVEDGVTGFVVPERDAESLADRLQCILSDDDIHHKLSTAARRKIALWDDEAMIADFRAAIRFAIERHGSKNAR